MEVHLPERDALYHLLSRHCRAEDGARPVRFYYFTSHKNGVKQNKKVEQTKAQCLQ